MKKFVIRTLSFLLPFLILGISVEMLLRRIPNNYSHKSAFLNTNAPDINILILGSSHAYFGINPTFFSKRTFNAANVSQTLNIDNKIIKRHSKDFSQLSHIIIPISYGSLFSSMEDGKEAWRIKNYHIYQKVYITRNVTDFFEILNNNISTIKMKLFSYYINNEHQITCSHFGWGTTNEQSHKNNLQTSGKIAAQRHSKNILSLETDAILTKNLAALHEIISWGQSKGIKILFITTPAHRHYREHLNPAQLNKTYYIISEIVNTYKNCKYTNYLDHSDFTEKDFFDADHLSAIGAKKLSLKLDDVIENWP